MTTKIKANENGPYIVTGWTEVELKDETVKTFSETETCALCSCGKSQNKPFCDGSHMK